MLLSVAGVIARAADPAGPTDSEWLDIESRIQYGYYTEDIHAVERVEDTLDSGTGGGAMRRYYLALARYRLASLEGSRSPDQALRAAEGCVASLEDASKVEGYAPEALALESACDRVLAQLKPMSSVHFNQKSDKVMHRALALAPKNPRVLLLSALGDYQLGRDRSAVISQLQSSIQVFERERTSVKGPPTWGAPDAYAFLARTLLDQGDAVAARGALEHALLLVPDFDYAHRLMARITTG